MTVRPFVAEDLTNQDLSVRNVTTVDPSRTFWDKAVILQGLRRWFERRRELRGGGQRVSRHYYDVSRLLAFEAGQNAANNLDMAQNCVRHAKMFFNRPDFDLASAVPGSFALTPHDEMFAILERDYEAIRAKRRIGRPSTVATFRNQIAQILQEEPDLASLEILRRVRSEGYKGGKTALYELVALLRPTPGQPLVPLKDFREFSQHDFGEVVVQFRNGTRQIIHFFASL